MGLLPRDFKSLVSAISPLAHGRERSKKTRVCLAPQRFKSGFLRTVQFFRCVRKTIRREFTHVGFDECKCFFRVQFIRFTQSPPNGFGNILVATFHKWFNEVEHDFQGRRFSFWGGVIDE